MLQFPPLLLWCSEPLGHCCCCCHHPQVVLVNGQTASTSELLAGALRDNYHAMLIGEPTFGKGRTQRVLELSDGSTLLVSTFEYFTPSHAKVDKVGLQPDVMCAPEVVLGEQWQAGAVAGGSLGDDPCIVMAAQRLAAE
jgi:C-terminal processing protease CtpA/Prc